MLQTVIIETLKIGLLMVQVYLLKKNIYLFIIWTFSLIFVI